MASRHVSSEHIHTSGDAQADDRRAAGHGRSDDMFGAALGADLVRRRYLPMAAVRERYQNLLGR